MLFWLLLIMAILCAGLGAALYGARVRAHSATAQLRDHLARVPLAVVEWGPEWRIVRWEGEAERIFGYPAAARQLAAGGYRVLEAGSGEEAVALLATVSIGVVVTDTCMPGGISGVELIRRIRAAYPGQPILGISGVDASRFDDDPPPDDVPFLARPFSMDELLARVQAVLAHLAA